MIQGQGLADVELTDAASAASRTDYWLEANLHHKGGIYAAARRRSAHLRTLLQTIDGFTRQRVQFYCTDVPFSFAERDGKEVFVLKGVIGNFKLNTVTLRDAESRAREVADVLVAPLLSAIDGAFESSGVEYYALLVSYGSENFVIQDAVNKLEPECLAIVVAAERAHEFSRGRTTVDELLTQADCYIADRNRRGGLSKVKIAARK